jgi:hypothetical protein
MQLSRRGERRRWSGPTSGLDGSPSSEAVAAAWKTSPR